MDSRRKRISNPYDYMSEYSNDSGYSDSPQVYDGIGSYRKKKSANRSEIDHDIENAWNKVAQIGSQSARRGAHAGQKLMSKAGAAAGEFALK